VICGKTVAGSRYSDHRDFGAEPQRLRNALRRVSGLCYRPAYTRTPFGAVVDFTIAEFAEYIATRAYRKMDSSLVVHSADAGMQILHFIKFHINSTKKR
jgi:hypothetical protein